MNILIINAFGNSPTGKIKFNSFLNLIKKIFKKVSENSGIENFKYIIRTPSKLEDYIFNYFSNPNDETSEIQNRKNFNSLDMVFIDGIESYSPWKKRSHFLSKFIELCKLANKVLYAGGVALEILIYYLSIGSINEYNIINSKGEIKSLEELNKIPLQFLNGIKKNELFLDFATGDLLEYRNNDNSWEPIMNIGLHHQNTAEKYFSRGKYVLDESFKGKDYSKNEFAMSTYCQEIKVKIIRQYISHYLVQNCPIEFIGICSLEWFPHFVNVTAKKLQFKTICQSDKGPIVIEHENSIGVAFHSEEKFKDSLKILENFIKKKFNEVKDKLLKIKNIKIFISANNNNEISPVFKMFKDNDDRLRGKFAPDEEIPSNPFSLLGKVTTSCLFNRAKKVKHEAKHVGLGINNREMIFVENNYINHQTFFRLKKNQAQKKNTKIENFKKNRIKLLSSVDKQKRISFVSNTSKDNKSLSSISTFRNRGRPITSIDKNLIKRGSSTVKREKNLKELNIKNSFNFQNRNSNYINRNLKLKTFSSCNNNNIFEISKNNKSDENAHKQLLKLLITKRSSNANNTEKGKEIQKEDEDELDDFQNYQSKYPRLPTLNELGYLLNNTKNIKSTNLEINDNVNSNEINFEKNKMENNKKENILNYNSNKTLFLRKSINNNIENSNNDKKNSIKKKLILKSAIDFGSNEKNKNQKDINFYKTYKPIISQKYEVNDRFENF